MLKLRIIVEFNNALQCWYWTSYKWYLSINLQALVGNSNFSRNIIFFFSYALLRLYTTRLSNYLIREVKSRVLL